MKIKLLLVSIFILSIGQVKAGDFDWFNELNVQATADPSGFRIKLGTRFNIGDAQVRSVINQVNSTSDAYMVLRLGELSSRPINDVLHTYHANKNNGWGTMARELGIKPGSRAFHSLKRGHDLGDSNSRGKNKKKDKKNKNKSKSKGNKNKH